MRLRGNQFQPGAALGNPVDALDRLLRSSVRLSTALADTPLAAALATRLNSPDVVLRKTLLRVRFGPTSHQPGRNVREG